MDFEERYALVTRNLPEILGKDEFRTIMMNRSPVIYWGTAPTGRIHVGYLVPLQKIADFLNAGCTVIILIADLHAVLDSNKSSFEQVAKRTQYYERIIKITLVRLGADISRIQFIIGSKFQKNQEYFYDVMRASTITTVHDALKSATEVVKQSDNPLLSSLLYPVMQVLDMEHLGADAFFGGIDQRKINVLGLSLLPALGYSKRAYLMNRMVPSLSKVAGGTNGKMSSSDNVSKIDLLDNKKTVDDKVKQAYCLEGEVNDNTPLILMENVIFPILERLGENFVCNRPAKWGGPLTYTDFESIRRAFESKELHPSDFKKGIVDSLNFILDPVRKEFETNENQQLLIDAYGSI